MKPLTHAQTDARPLSKSDGSPSQQGTLPGGGDTHERVVAFSARASSTVTPTSCSEPEDLVHRIQVQDHEIEHFLRAGLGIVQGLGFRV
jgi:hypothetical protein